MSDCVEEFYPELRGDYSNKIGLTGEIAINIVLDDYDVVPHLLNEPGVDVEVENLSVAVEIWNHSKQHAYLERLKGVIRNLSNYSFKFHIVSFISPEYRKIEEANGITVIELGFQIIPEKYLTFYQQYYGLKRKKTRNKRSLKIISNRLKPLIEAIEKQQKEKALEQFKDIPHPTITRKSNHSHVCSTFRIRYSELDSVVFICCSEVFMKDFKLGVLEKLRNRANSNVFVVNVSGESKASAIHSIDTESSNYYIKRISENKCSSDPPLLLSSG